MYVKHKKRETWEVSGGHRELKEETGAIRFNIKHIGDYLCDYSVERKRDNKNYGRVYLFHDMPENLTYPKIQPILIDEVMKRILLST